MRECQESPLKIHRLESIEEFIENSHGSIWVAGGQVDTCKLTDMGQSIQDSAIFK